METALSLSRCKQSEATSPGGSCSHDMFAVCHGIQVPGARPVPPGWQHPALVAVTCKGACRMYGVGCVGVVALGHWLFRPPVYPSAYACAWGARVQPKPQPQVQRRLGLRHGRRHSDLLSNDFGNVCDIPSTTASTPSLPGGAPEIVFFCNIVQF